MTNDILKNVWPEWQIEKQLGKGSFGVVYKAVRRDHNVESFAAIKVISIPSDASEIDSLRSEGLDMNGTRTYLQGIVDDFVSEIQLMESLKGIQNIVSVEDYKVVEKTDEIGWDIFIRMELLTPFNSYICARKMTEAEVIKLGCDICTALEICARRNVIHRDIKPENIFINDFGDFKLGDFGVARKMESMSSGLSSKGTPAYMAPEVANNQEYAKHIARVDIYSLGVVLYRMLNNNRLPFLDPQKQLHSYSERKEAIDRRLRGETPDAPCDASPEMADLILRACAFAPEDRFASATEMKQALENVLNGNYVIGADGLNGTKRVRAAVTNLNGTKAVRKAPATGTAKKTKPSGFNTFGDATNDILSTVKSTAVSALNLITDKVQWLISIIKNGETKQRVAALAAVAAIVLLLIFGLMQCGNCGGGNSSNNDDTGNDGKVDIVEYSSYDKEQIAGIISASDALAAAEDYEGALEEVQKCLIAYPESEALQNKADEYTNALNEQIKQESLAEAATLAESGDYISAMAVIENAQETQGDNTEYQSALITYRNAYKADVIYKADNLSANGDYLGAIQIVESAVEVIGNNDELTQKKNSYEQSYVTSICKQVDDLISNGKYDEATSLVNNALTIVPQEKELEAKLDYIDSIKPKYLVNILEPFNSNDYEEFSNGASVMMGGIKRTNGFMLDVYGWNGQSCAVFNLNKAYSRLTGITGYIDDRIGNGNTWEVCIYTDDYLAFSCVVKPGDLPQEFSIDLTGITKLEFITSDGCGFQGNIGFAELLITGSGATQNTTVENTNVQYLVDIIEPFQTNDYEEFSNGASAMMGGIKRTNGFMLDVYGWNGQSCAVFNLNKAYSRLTGITGYIDDRIGNGNTWEVYIYTDDYLAFSCVVKPGDLPQEFSIDLTGITKLEFKTSDGCGFQGNIGFAELEIA